MSEILTKLGEVEKMQPTDPRFHEVYGIHAYWAKKYPNVISQCIKLLSNPNELVLDPFAGVGVTPIEALSLGRKGIGIDLCPLSVFIMEKTLTPLTNEELESLKKRFFNIKKDLWGDGGNWGYIKELYRTKCPVCECNDAFMLEARYDCINNVEHPRFREWELKAVKSECENCGKKGWKIKRGAKVKGIFEEEKALVKFALKKVDDLKDEEDLLKNLETEKVKGYYPTWTLIPNTRINVYDDMSIPDIYTKRNLLVLAALKNAIFSLNNGEEKEMLKFAFSCSLHLARMTDYKRAS